jgi:hypothetical protein
MIGSESWRNSKSRIEQKFGKFGGKIKELENLVETIKNLQKKTSQNIIVTKKDLDHPNCFNINGHHEIFAQKDIKFVCSFSHVNIVVCGIEF